MTVETGAVHHDDYRLDVAADTDQRSAEPSDADLSHERRLALALANYLRDSQSGNKEEVRCAIRAWRRDSAHRALQPEQLLVQFKRALATLPQNQWPADYDRLLMDRRDLIVICIEEYFSGA